MSGLVVHYVIDNIDFVSQIALLLVLAYVTIFRREISCNSDYHARLKSSSSSSALVESTDTNGNENGDGNTNIDSSPLLDEESIHYEKQASSAIFLDLTPDLQINCLTYLHPRDVISFGSCCRLSRFLIDNHHYHSHVKALTSSSSSPKKNLSSNSLYELGSLSSSLHSYSNIFLNSQSSASSPLALKQYSFSDRLWLNLWNRDYAWILDSWDIGKGAMIRSLKNINDAAEAVTENNANNNNDNVVDANSSISIPPILYNAMLGTIMTSTSLATTTAMNNVNTITMKEFYLTFSQIWINYTIAGHSSFKSCLTGIHGHVFNITKFLNVHPGSPESILVQGGGKDSTAFFESVGHSISARKIAVNELVEVIDLGCCCSSGTDTTGGGSSSRNKRRSRSFDSSLYNSLNSSCDNRDDVSSSWPLNGLKSKSKLLLNNHNAMNIMNLIPKNRSRPRRMMGTLVQIRNTLQTKEQEVKRKASKLKANIAGGRHGSVNVYFDPFDWKWHGWYLNSNFEPEFVNDLE